MGFRQYDADCTECRNTRPILFWVDFGDDAPRRIVEECRHCNRETVHIRVVSLIAEYHGEKSLNVEVHGGQFDTAGSRAFKTMAEIPEPKNMEDRADRRAHIEAYKERFASSEWKEMKKENASIARENAAKQKRLAAIKSGANINMRRDKLPGDPKITA